MGFVLYFLSFIALVTAEQPWKDRQVAYVLDDIPSSEPGTKAGKIPLESDDESDGDPHGPPVPYLDIFPPKYKPGDVLKGTTSGEVNRALDDILRAAGLMTDRSCAVGIANEGRSLVTNSVLVNPRVWVRSGMVAATPAYKVEVGHTSLKLFVKKDWTATGTVGVVTYDIEGTDLKVAVMWAVPFDWNLYDLWFNVKVYPRSYKIGKHMYNQMYYYAGAWRAEGWEERHEYGITVRAAMTHHKQSKLQVYVDASAYDPEEKVEHFADCSYHAGWARNYCWRECHSGGYCWVNQKCKKSRDCSGESACYKSCTKTP